MDTVLETAEGDSMFYPKVSIMLSQMKEGAKKDSILKDGFDEILSDIRESYPEFTEWMAGEDGKKLISFY